MSWKQKINKGLSLTDKEKADLEANHVKSFFKLKDNRDKLSIELGKLCYELWKFVCEEDDKKFILLLCNDWGLGDDYQRIARADLIRYQLKQKIPDANNKVLNYLQLYSLQTMWSTESFDLSSLFKTMGARIVAWEKAGKKDDEISTYLKGFIKREKKKTEPKRFNHSKSFRSKKSKDPTPPKISTETQPDADTDKVISLHTKTPSKQPNDLDGVVSLLEDISDDSIHEDSLARLLNAVTEILITARTSNRRIASGNTVEIFLNRFNLLIDECENLKIQESQAHNLKKAK
jgi:hypothetical protein